MGCIKDYIERNTTFIIQKACALRIFCGCVLSGMGIVKAAASCTAFSARVIRKWAVEIFRDYFAIISNIDDVTDKSLELELLSNRGKHPKWLSLMTDENFKQDAREYILKNGASPI